MVLDPKVFLTLKKQPNYYNQFIILFHVLFQLVVFLYKKNIDTKEIGDRRVWLMKTAVNSLANLANIKSCFILSLLFFFIVIFKTFTESLGSRSFFWSLSVAVLLLIFHVPFWGNIALR